MYPVLVYNMTTAIGMFLVMYAIAWLCVSLIDAIIVLDDARPVKCVQCRLHKATCVVEYLGTICTVCRIYHQPKMYQPFEQPVIDKFDKVYILVSVSMRLGILACGIYILC
jgi:hypothetical protein